LKNYAGTYRCLLCMKTFKSKIHFHRHTETIEHLIVQCPTARSVWFQGAGQIWVQNLHPTIGRFGDSFRNSLATLSSCRPKRKRNELATLSIPCCSLLWLERNNQHFERHNATEEEIISRIRKEFQLAVGFGYICGPARVCEQ
jgi:hypothetical protein